MTPTDTIVAPSTPYGVGGISVVRLSGPAALEIALSLSHSINGGQPTFLPRYATLVSLVDSTQVEFDEAIVTYFPGPDSYTGEDVVEISCHGSPAIVQTIVSASLEAGSRIAEPGEFTRRAYLNGKFDLVQAESVAALIRSQSLESTQLNYQLMRGRLSEVLLENRSSLVRILSLVEFELDISEDPLQPDLSSTLRTLLVELMESISLLSDSYTQGRLLTRGATVVIVGEPNVGKSTLLNALTNSDRAITNAEPGTTRDTLDVALFIAGVPIKLVDTAGLRDSGEIIEMEGVRRARNQIEQADLLLVVESPDSPLGVDIIKDSTIDALFVINKIDLLSSNEIHQLHAHKKDSLLVSAKKGSGLKELRSALRERLGVSSFLSATVAITTARQHKALLACLQALKRAQSLIKETRCEYELVSIELRDSLEELDCLLGKTTNEDILSAVFDSFCVGK